MSEAPRKEKAQRSTIEQTGIPTKKSGSSAFEYGSAEIPDFSEEKSSQSAATPQDELPRRLAIGPDISFYQDEPGTPGGVDFAKMRREADFVIIRAGQNLWPDQNFERHWKEAKASGLPRGCYWYYDSRADPEKQAELWHSLLGGDLGELPLFADFEESYGGEHRGWQDWRIFLEHLKSIVGDRPIAIYTANSYWSENAIKAISDPADLEYFHQYPLWIANYGVSSPAIPKPWGKNEWLFWQFTETGDGAQYGVESKGVDLNYFHGSPATLHQLVASGFSVDKKSLNFALNDRPYGKDHLGYKDYAEAIAEILSGEYTQTPLTVGIYAAWGMGKSFLLEEIKTRLEEHTNEKLRFFFIEFNAWIYSGSENLWAGMITRLYDRIEEHYGNNQVQAFRRKKAIEQIGKTFKKNWMLLIVFGPLALILSILLNFDAIQQNWIVFSQALAAISWSSLLVTLPSIIKAAREIFNSSIYSRSQEIANLSSRKDFRDKIGFMQDIKDELNEVCKLIQKSDEDNEQKSRFVIVVDDLDRCPPEKAVEVLEAIMLLLSERQKDPFIVILAIDARILVKAIEERYGKVLTESGVSGYEFLDKIVQIPFRIPPPNDDAILNYVDALLWPEDTPEAAETIESGASQSGSVEQPPARGESRAEGGRETMEVGTQPQVQVEEPMPSEEEPFTEEELKAFEGYTGSLSRNPRRVKRIVNIYRLSRILAKNMNLPAELLIKWVILTEQWPFRVTWIMQDVEDVFQDGQEWEAVKGLTLPDLYERVKPKVINEKSQKLALLDEDAELFAGFIAKEPTFDALLIQKNLRPLCFNLNPAMQSEVLKSVLPVNGEK